MGACYEVGGQGSRAVWASVLTVVEVSVRQGVLQAQSANQIMGFVRSVTVAKLRDVVVGNDRSCVRVPFASKLSPAELVRTGPRP